MPPYPHDEGKDKTRLSAYSQIFRLQVERLRSRRQLCQRHDRVPPIQSIYHDIPVELVLIRDGRDEIPATRKDGHVRDIVERREAPMAEIHDIVAPDLMEGMCPDKQPFAF